jgi:predicted alpha/beta hydrolase family esterase
MKQDQFTLLISSGYADSGPGHWQLAWVTVNSLKVIQEDWINPNRDEGVQALYASIRSATLPVVLVVIVWAAQRSYIGRVAIKAKSPSG